MVTYRGRCTKCGPVSTRHPLQVSEATGAAGTQIGPRALGLAGELHHRLGLTVRKTCAVLGNGFGLRLTPGGLMHALGRVSGRLRAQYEKLSDQVRTSPTVYADETSWRVGGPGWWLWVFTTPQATLYRVESGRGQDVVERTLGDSYAGVLVSDCLASYDLIRCRKHKCYAHHLRAVEEGLQKRTDSAYLKRVRMLLHAAQALGGQDRTSPGYGDLLRRLEHWADNLFTMPRADPVEEGLANRIRKRREHLFTFLYYRGVESTNNRAERQLRPAVIAGKLSCGNKTKRGKRVWEILTSLAVTCQQRGDSFVELVANSMRLTAPRLATSYP